MVQSTIKNLWRQTLYRAIFRRTPGYCRVRLLSVTPHDRFGHVADVDGQIGSTRFLPGVARQFIGR